LILDAFGSDAIPMHLLTREALGLYRARMEPGGLLAAHVSNRHVDLRGVLAALARDAGWIALVRTSTVPGADGPVMSTWMLMAAPTTDTSPLRHAGWQPVDGARGPLWTDDAASVLSVLRWE
jgi:hypothetical protein